MTIPSIISRIEAGETGREIDRSAFLALGFRFDFPDDEYVVAPNDDGTTESLIYGDRLKISTSLDACRALHESLLPDWRIEEVSEFLKDYPPGWKWIVYLQSFHNGYSTAKGNAETFAAAYLIAILKAVEAKGGAQ